MAIAAITGRGRPGTTGAAVDRLPPVWLLAGPAGLPSRSSPHSKSGQRVDWRVQARSSRSGNCSKVSGRLKKETTPIPLTLTLQCARLSCVPCGRETAVQSVGARSSLEAADVWEKEVRWPPSLHACSLPPRIRPTFLSPARHAGRDSSCLPTTLCTSDANLRHRVSSSPRRPSPPPPLVLTSI